MSQKITAVSGAAKKAGLRPGDELMRINSQLVLDLIDYEALCAQRQLELEIRRNGETKFIRVRKGEYDSLGLEFARPLMSGMRMCANHCLFCFVDQLPPYARESLHAKDDDWRTSLMMGSYVTLTNVSDREIDRIIARHASPLYISVHATDADLRTRLLGTPRAARLMGQLKKLAEGGIEFHCQCVLCPGINDGAALEETIATLAEMYPAAQSLALVPVGLTDHREGLCPLQKYTKAQAQEVINLAHIWQEKLLKKLGTRFVFPSDEFYLTAESPLPDGDSYEGYVQIDDGVGMLRLFEEEYLYAWEDMSAPDRPSSHHAIMACGVSAAPFMADLLKKHPVPGADVRVRMLENGFFGPSVTVTGLLTGSDLIRQLKDDPADTVLITSCMLRDGTDCFLDDTTIPQVEEALGKRIVVTGRRGDELLQAILDL